MEKKLVIKKAITFIGILYGIHLILLGFDMAVRYRYPTRISEAFLLKNAKNISVLICGDSHPLTDINSSLFPNSYNFSNGGENLVQTYYRLERLYEKFNYTPEIILLSIDPHNFSSWHTDNFAPESEWSQYVNFLKLGFEKRRPFLYGGMWVRSWLPYVGRGRDLFMETLAHLRGDEVKKAAAGIELRKMDFSKKSMEERSTTAKNRLAVHFENFNPWDPSLVDYFLKIIDMAQAHGTRVVLIRYPLSSDYIEGHKSYGDAGEILTKVKTALGTRQVPILDYQKFAYDRPDLFCDSDHLNLKGSDLFTRAVYEKMRSLGYIPTKGRTEGITGSGSEARIDADPMRLHRKSPTI